MQTKLTLRLDKELIETAKRYAEISGKSLSQLVADYFSLLGSKPSGQAKLTPKVKALKGALKSVSEDDYRRYLEDKHR